MVLKKCIAIIAIVMVVGATSANNIEPRFIKIIGDLVKKSNTLVILAIDGKIQAVTVEINATKELATYRGVLKNKKPAVIKSTYKPRSVKDVIQKLTTLSKKYATFLAYFRAANGKPIKGSITTETTRPIGLLGNLLGTLGIIEDEEGLLPSLLSSLGINTSVKDIKKIEFESQKKIK